MIETRRAAPARILKQRDVLSGAAVPAAPANLDALAPRTPSAATVSTAETPPAKRCTTKEARLVAGENGATAVEVRCSCGEWTRVELQIGNAPETAR